MFKQRDNNIHFKVGDIIPCESYRNLSLSFEEKAKLFKRHLYRLHRGQSPIFKTQTHIAHPERRADLKKEIEASELLGNTQDGKRIYLYRHTNDTCLLREIGRLREIAFRAVGEGTGQTRDLDKYDTYYDHLVLWDASELEIVGAYRLGDARNIIKDRGQSGLYTDYLFDYGKEMQPYMEQGLELGRSFVQPKYWCRRSLDYLWFGIGAYLHRYPRFRYLFGPVSISNQLPQQAKELLVYFYHCYFQTPEKLARSKTPFVISAATQTKYSELFEQPSYPESLKLLKTLLANMGANIPTLYKQYTELCEPGGVTFLDFGVDKGFSNCIDGLVMVDIQQLKPKKRARYIDIHRTNDNETTETQI